MIDASRFAKSTIKEDEKSFKFGLSNEGAIDALKELIEKIRSGDVVVQRVQSGIVSKSDEFAMSGLFIEYAEKR